MLYLDSSALVKVYAIESGHEEVESLLKEHAGFLLTSVVTYAEVLSALCRAHRSGRITDGEYAVSKSRFRQNWKEILMIQLKEEVLADAERLIESHGLSVSRRGGAGGVCRRNQTLPEEKNLVGRRCKARHPVKLVCYQPRRTSHCDWREKGEKVSLTPGGRRSLSL